MELNGVRLPSGYTGIGLHDTPGASTAAWSYHLSAEHAQSLKAMGVTLYKLFVDSIGKVQRARAYVDNGIVPIVRPWIPEPWGRGLPVTPADQLRFYVDVGVQLIELGNEWNISCEWATPIPGPVAIAREVCNWWEVCLQRASEVPGLIPLFPSNTPGGNVDHRLCYFAIVAELCLRGLEDTVRHVAIHPRPHNNPPWVEWTESNTVTFDEWRWIRDAFRAGGMDPYYWATEHGYSLGDAQNQNYQPIDIIRHGEFNRELQKRMDPAHPNRIQSRLAGHCHWYEAGWGHWGAWAKDALRDSPAPEMPAPSPLWMRMESEPLLFDRYEDEPPPPPPPPPPVQRAQGIDVSYHQRELDWQQVHDAGISFAFIRQSVGLCMDERCYPHINQSRDKGVLRGSYHYLMPMSGNKQARLSESIYQGLHCEMPCALDVENEVCNAQQVRDWLARWHSLTNRRPLVYTSRYKWHQIVGTGAAWGRELADLWVAHAGVDQPALPDVWDDWLFWQYGQKVVPGYDKPVDLNWFNGTPEELIAWATGEPPPPPPEPDPPYDLIVSYQEGGPLIVGSYPEANVPLVRTDPWGNVVSTTTGSKPEWGPGGFEVYATPEGELFTLTVEGWSYDVQTCAGQMAVVSWV